MSSGVTAAPVADSTRGGPDRPSVELRVAMTTSAQPARLAWPAKDGPDSRQMMGARPDIRASCTKVVTIPSPKSSSLARAPPPSPQQTTGQRFRSARASMRSSLRWLRGLWLPPNTL